jgi:anti-sigma regulatory factor (Ser/Thr protein kinase)
VSTARAVLRPEPRSAGLARRLVAEACAAAASSADADTAALLTTELVTNALVHAGTDVEMVVEAGPDGVRVEVRDGDPRLPERRDYDEDATTGRGGLLVEALADAHGAAVVPGVGKRV